MHINDLISTRYSFINFYIQQNVKKEAKTSQFYNNFEAYRRDNDMLNGTIGNGGPPPNISVVNFNNSMMNKHSKLPKGNYGPYDGPKGNAQESFYNSGSYFMRNSQVQSIHPTHQPAAFQGKTEPFGKFENESTVGIAAGPQTHMEFLNQQKLEFMQQQQPLQHKPEIHQFRDEFYRPKSELLTKPIVSGIEFSPKGQGFHQSESGYFNNPTVEGPSNHHHQTPMQYQNQFYNSHSSGFPSPSMDSPGKHNTFAVTLKGFVLILFQIAKTLK